MYIYVHNKKFAYYNSLSVLKSYNWVLTFTYTHLHIYVCLKMSEWPSIDFLIYRLSLLVQSRPFPHPVSTRLAQHLVKVDVTHTRKLCQGRRQWLGYYAKWFTSFPIQMLSFLKRTLALLLHNLKTITIFFCFPKTKIRLLQR